MRTKLFLIFSIIHFLSACESSSDVSSIDNSTTDDIADIELAETNELNETSGTFDEIEILIPPFELSVDDDTEVEDNSSISNLDADIKSDLELTSEWDHPAGFYFEDGISNTLIGIIKDENFNIYLTFHTGFESSVYGYFEASFYRISVYGLDDNLIDQKIIASNERLKDGGIGHHHSSICSFNEGLSYNVETTSFVYDYEDEEDFEDIYVDKVYYQIQTDGMIEMIPE